jgi:molybdate transport system ATP-binding protein
MQNNYSTGVPDGAPALFITNMTKYTFRITDGIARNEDVRLATPINIAIPANRHVAIIGPNGAGKSLLVETMLGHYPLVSGTKSNDFSPAADNSIYNNVKYVTFRDSYGSADSGYYYQQRWNTQEQDEVPTVEQIFAKVKVSNEQLQRHLFELFDITPMLPKKVIQLSSGELRKFQLAKVMLTSPRVLIIDNPFIGLDAKTRVLLADLMKRIARDEHIQIILVLSLLNDIPDFITDVIPVVNMKVYDMMPRERYLERFESHDSEQVTDESYLDAIRALPDTSHADYDKVVVCNKVCIRYDDRTILKELDWTVHKGEKWALSGDNGSGKSTLLSLICADNPQSYACDIHLFDRKRGSGESIWDIKRRIGYISPEMHRAYQRNVPTIEIVASGLRDSVGLYQRPRPEQLPTCMKWLEVFGVADKADRPFLQLSSGEQRLVLLARAFVKDPELLVLDEPLHGLDTYNRRRVKSIINAFCARPDKTMIMVTHYASELPDCITNSIFLKKNI